MAEHCCQDEERTKVGLNQVPSLPEMNQMLARTPQELELFEKLDKELEWPSPAEGVCKPARNLACCLCFRVPHLGVAAEVSGLATASLRSSQHSSGCFASLSFTVGRIRHPTFVVLNLAGASPHS